MYYAYILLAVLLKLLLVPHPEVGYITGRTLLLQYSSLVLPPNGPNSMETSDVSPTEGLVMWTFF